MNKILLLLAFTAHLSVYSQSAYSYLDGNNTSAIVSSGGTYFNNSSTSNPGYEYPKGSGNHLIYANSFWYGGKDMNGDVKLSGQMYEWGKDLFPGPLSDNGAGEISPSTATQYDQVYSVSKVEIEYHMQHFYDVGYVAPLSITDWPAHGDIGLDQDFFLAPFVDVNNDQVYTPQYGDYPLIRGDVASYVIMNDKLSMHQASGADPIGIECHLMFYQFITSDDLNNTTFVNVKVINRGTQTIYDFAVGGLLDTDIGDSNDDFMGSDSARNLIYSYNATNIDGEYGTNPPAVGLVSLNHDLKVAGSYSGVSGPTSIPNTPNEYILNMTGYHKDGSLMTEGGNGYGGTVANSFQYHGDPNVSGEWSEIDEANFASDKRLFFATETITLVPYTEFCYDFAILVGDGGDHLENVTNVKTAATFVQDYYNSESYVCENYESVMSVDEMETFDFVVYPQPALNGFKIKAPAVFDYQITTIDGQLVNEDVNIAPNTQIDLNLSAGIYLIKVVIGNEQSIQKIIVN